MPEAELWSEDQGLQHMRVSVFGLGYVGTVSAGCLVEMGHTVIGVDTDPGKVAAVNAGISPIVEELIADVLKDGVRSGRLGAVASPEEAVAASDLSLICVGTPSAQSGEADITHVLRVARQIGKALKSKQTYHVIVVRSTVPPGTVEAKVIPSLEDASGLCAGRDFGVCFHPEFLREGSSVRDFRDPSRIVIGAEDERAARFAASLYEGVCAPVFFTPVRTAEMIKYAENCFHALKVVFGNEIGTLCRALGVDSHILMHIVCQDAKLNISPAYLTPGFAFGGSCLPKDVRALQHLAAARHVELPVIAAVSRSNEIHIGRAVELVCACKPRVAGLLGLSFKQGTDDLRESPLVELAARLAGKGIRVRVYDEEVVVSRLRGGNRAYIERHLPHIDEWLVSDLDALIEEADVIVAGASKPRFAQMLMTQGHGKVVVDLVRLYPSPPMCFKAYHGICW